MAIYASDPATEKLLCQLAEIWGKTPTEAIHEAVKAALEMETRKRPLHERIKPIQDRIAQYPSTGLEADKAFYDELSGDP